MKFTFTENQPVYENFILQKFGAIQHKVSTLSELLPFTKVNME